MKTSFYQTVLLKWHKLFMRKLLFKIIYYILKGDDLMMAMLFASKVILGKIEFKDVPRLLKPQVKEILEENGLGDLALEE